MKSIGIIGAGASGMMAAISAASCGAKVTLFERKDRIGKKILVTGNGRCNFSNVNLSSDNYYTDDDSFVESVLTRFDNDDLCRFFTGLGMLIREKNGLYYPACEQASTVLDLFRNALNEYDIDIKTESFVTLVTKKGDSFKVKTEDGQEYSFDKVILSCGGKAGIGKKEQANGYDILKSFNIKMSPLYPSLTQVLCEGANFKALAGVRSECSLYVFEDDNLAMKQFGEVLFADYGISGIVTFQVSHFVAEALSLKKKVSIVLDLLPGFTNEDIERFVNSKLLLHNTLTVEEFFNGLLNKKLNMEIIKKSGFKPTALISEYPKEKVIEAVCSMKEFVVIPKAVNGFDQAQVTGGGVLTSELTAKLEAKSVPGLYVTGELINVDGLCGGYNLQWAFSTGYIAGENASL